MVVDAYELGLDFDSHRIVTVAGFIGHFPSEEEGSEDGEDEGGRESVSQLLVKKNPTM